MLIIINNNPPAGRKDWCCWWMGFDFGVVRARVNKMVTSNCVFKALISFQVFCLIILSGLREGKN